MNTTNVNRKNKNKILAATVIVAGIIASISVGMYAFSTPTQAAAPANPYEVAKNLKQKSPQATIAQGLVSDVLKDKELKKISEKSEGSREDALNPRNIVTDTGVSVSMYLDNSTNSETLAVTVENTGTRAVFLDTLVLSGFVRGDVPGTTIETVYRPVISDPYDVVGATTTTPEVIPPGKSLTAYTQAELGAEAYGALACYSYKPQTDDKSADSEGNIDRESNFCTTLPLTWIK